MPFSKQEIYDMVRDHLMNQQERSITSLEFGFTTCAYRSKNRKMCAIGCLIPDRLYNKKLEGSGYYDLPNQIRRFLGFNNARLLDSLQMIHDTQSVSDWAESLYELAEKHGLRP
jgi:hypothetical protein